MSSDIAHTPFAKFVQPNSREDIKKCGPFEEGSEEKFVPGQRRTALPSVPGGRQEGSKSAARASFVGIARRSVRSQTVDSSPALLKQRVLTFEGLNTRRPAEHPHVNDDNDAHTHPDLAVKLALHIPESDYFIHLFQTYAVISMGLLANPSAVDTHMLQVTVGTLPADTMAYMRAMMSDQDTTKLPVMLNVQKLEPVSLALTPAMQLRRDEKQA
ncbi:hypothetical protein LshimejAT787_0702300 [Lyophyllum shimeji]|uniref:Uncharacterized protein n=1 Tax=Lyophyllum shimeji TaxID=47721 RepID=A0A9P3PNK5_LYOSH|nr:hypothetical protein LshimejAT787_0702300 [Lyophyllum shimeji]